MLSVGFTPPATPFPGPLAAETPGLSGLQTLAHGKGRGGRAGRGERGEESGQQLPDFSESWGWGLETCFQKFFMGSGGRAGLRQWLMCLLEKRLKISTLGFHSPALTQLEADGPVESQGRAGVRGALLLCPLTSSRTPVSHWKPRREWKHPFLQPAWGCN